MRIKEIKVEGLFDMFNHTITLNLEHRLTIVYGANGVGI
jgi:chromosome segregation ATPase